MRMGICDWCPQPELACSWASRSVSCAASSKHRVLILGSNVHQTTQSQFIYYMTQHRVQAQGACRTVLGVALFCKQGVHCLHGCHMSGSGRQQGQRSVAGKKGGGGACMQQEFTCPRKCCTVMACGCGGVGRQQAGVTGRGSSSIMAL